MALVYLVVVRGEVMLGLLSCIPSLGRIIVVVDFTYSELTIIIFKSCSRIKRKNNNFDSDCPSSLNINDKLINRESIRAQNQLND